MQKKSPRLQNHFFKSTFILSSVLLSSSSIFAHGDHKSGDGHHHHHGSHQEPQIIESDIVQLNAFEKNKNEQSDVITEKLQEAVSLTAKGKLDEARTAYEQIALDHPEAGLPALSRFYSLTSSKEELDTFLQSVLEDDSINLLIKSRALVQAGKSRDAAVFLHEQSGEEAFDGDTALYYVELLDRLGSTDDATTFAIEYLEKFPGTEDSLVIAKHLMSRPETMHFQQPVRVLTILENEIAQQELEYESVTVAMDNLIYSYVNSDHYFLTRPEIIENASKAGMLSRLFTSRLLLQEGNPYESLDVLIDDMDFSNINSHVDILVAKEAIQRHSQVGEYEEADAIREQISVQENLASNSYLNYTAMKTQIAQGNFERAYEIFKSIDGDSLQGRDQHDYYLTQLRFASTYADYDSIIEGYLEYFERYDRSNLDLIFNVIFNQMMQTKDHVAFEEHIRNLFKEKPESTDPYLWLLAAESASEARLTPNELEAKYQYIVANPRDVTMLQALVDEIVPAAVEISNLAEEELVAYGIPFEEPQRLLTLAEKATLSMINARPYAPEPMRRLMELYRGMNKTDQEVAAVVDIVGENTNNAKILGNCGYVLATEGFPEKAITYYNKALELDPDNFKIRFNKASCFTRLGQWNDAVEFYQEGLENGYGGKQYHVHEFVQRLWAIADTIGTKKQTLEYFEEVSKDDSIPWQSQIISDIVAVMILEQDFEAAEKFRGILSQVAENTQDEDDFILLARAYQSIASGYAAQEDFEKSRAILEDGITYFDGNPAIVSKLKENMATMYVEAGEAAKAIDILVEMGMDESTPEASDSIYFAANIAERDGDIMRAAQLYKQFLDSESRSFSLRRQANSKLTQLGSNVN